MVSRPFRRPGLGSKLARDSEAIQSERGRDGFVLRLLLKRLELNMIRRSAMHKNGGFTKEVQAGPSIQPNEWSGRELLISKQTSTSTNLIHVRVSVLRGTRIESETLRVALQLPPRESLRRKTIMISALLMRPTLIASSSG